MLVPYSVSEMFTVFIARVSAALVNELIAEQLCKETFVMLVSPCQTAIQIDLLGSISCGYYVQLAPL